MRKKDDKIEMLAHERNFLWHLRRTTGNEIARAKDEVKTMITYGGCLEKVWSTCYDTRTLF